MADKTTKGSSTDMLPPVERSTAGIRECLFDEIQRLRNGIATPAESNAVARLAKEIGATVKLEIMAQKFFLGLGREDVTALPPPLSFEPRKSDGLQ